MLEHGGGILRAAADSGIAAEHWLDLSTGINPQGWPVPPLPAEVWRRLPERGDRLLAAAAAYYGTPHLLAVAGSQAAIQCLPALRAPGRVGMVFPCYAEHGAAWRRAGHSLLPLQPTEIDQAIDSLDVLLLLHPNNPTGQGYSLAQLQDWRRRLQRRGAWLVLDEAFMDATPERSLAPDCGGKGLVVLRSVGKFFGLAGLRLGFVAAWPALLAALEERLGPWAVSHPARWVGGLALADTAWQQQARQSLAETSARLAAMLAAAGLEPAGATALFQWVPTLRALRWQQALIQQAILVRRFEQPAALRFGLPGAEAEWHRLQQALAGLSD